MSITRPPLGGPHHIALTTSRVARLEAFYSEVLGLSLERTWHDEQGQHRSTWLRVPNGTVLMIERAAEKTGAGMVGWHLLALSIDVATRAAWEAWLAQHEVPVEHASPFSLFFRDPDGNRLALSHWPIDAASYDGGGPPGASS